MRSCLLWLLLTAPVWADPLTRPQAEQLALQQASAYDQARISERIAAEDVRIAHAALVPKLAIAVGGIFNTPGLGGFSGPAQIAANAVTEYQAGYTVTGTFDISGYLHAGMERSRALLAAAHAGTLVAGRVLVGATDEAYYGLALAAARVGAAEQNLATAQRAEQATGAMVAAGESPGVDQVRGHLVVLGRRDELEQARAAQSVAEHALKMLIGFDFDRPVVVTALSDPTNELQAFHPEGVLKRNELVQFAAQQRAGEQEVREARSELRPQLTYSLNLGPDTNSLGSGLYQHTGLAGGIFLNVPLSDGGISRAHEKQAQLRQELVESQRQLALRQFAQQYSDAFSQAQSAAARVPLTRAGLAQAEQDVDVSEARYRAGEATVIEVTDAQARLAVQRAAVNQARYDYQIAVTHLRQAVGP